MKRSEIKEGMRIGRLVFLEFSGKDWVFQCDCGRLYFTKGINYNSYSCGCYRLESRAERVQDISPVGKQRRDESGQFVKMKEDNNEH